MSGQWRCIPCAYAYTAEYRKKRVETADEWMNGYSPIHVCSICGTIKIRMKNGCYKCPPCAKSLSAKHEKTRSREPDKEHARRMKENAKKRTREWRDSHKEELRLHAQRVRAKRRMANGSHTVGEWLSVKAKYKNRCAACGSKERITKDHIIPLARGGTDFSYNLQPLCFPCNARKRAMIKPGAQHSLFDKIAPQGA